MNAATASNEQLQAHRRKALSKDLRTVLDSLNAEASKGSRGVDLVAPKPEEVAAARTRLEAVSGLELLLFIRDNPSFLAGRLFGWR